MIRQSGGGSEIGGGPQPCIGTASGGDGDRNGGDEPVRCDEDGRLLPLPSQTRPQRPDAMLQPLPQLPYWGCNCCDAVHSHDDGDDPCRPNCSHSGDNEQRQSHGDGDLSDESHKCQRKRGSERTIVVGKWMRRSLMQFRSEFQSIRRM